MKTPLFDICIVGGGINGCGIARDAAGRGLNVALCELTRPYYANALKIRMANYPG